MAVVHVRQLEIELLDDDGTSHRLTIVEDSPEHLVSYMPTGGPFAFPEGDWPTPDGRHPWHGRARWRGHCENGGRMRARRERRGML